MNERGSRPFDVVVWGATGFTGRLVADYLAAQPNVRFAIAGRNRSKLEAVRTAIAVKHPARAELPILVGEAHDDESLDGIAKTTRVMCATVGPFAEHGLPVVAACVRNGTDYCDITGEAHYIRRLIDAHHDAAVSKGVRIVPSCGFDSIPSDLGTFVLAEHARGSRGRALSEVRAYVWGARGGVSGGTATTMVTIFDVAAKDRAARRVLGDPYGLSPDRANDLNTDGRDSMTPSWDGDAGGWTAPWVMGSINSRVVRRSNALFSHRYGKTFRYSESLFMRGRIVGAVKAAATSVAMGAVGVTLALSGAARKLALRMLPSSGEGPSESTRSKGYFKLRFFGVLEGETRASVVATVTGQGDPGYAATSRMVSQAAMCLALDPPIGGFEGGVLTPATAMGTQLIERLKKADFTFEVADL